MKQRLPQQAFHEDAAGAVVQGPPTRTSANIIEARPA